MTPSCDRPVAPSAFDALIPVMARTPPTAFHRRPSRASQNNNNEKDHTLTPTDLPTTFPWLNGSGNHFPSRISRHGRQVVCDANAIATAEPTSEMIKKANCTSRCMTYIRVCACFRQGPLDAGRALGLRHAGESLLSASMSVRHARLL